MWAEVKSQHKSGYSAPESALQAGATSMEQELRILKDRNQVL